MPITLDDVDAIQRAMQQVSDEIDWIFNNKGSFPYSRKLRAFRILAEEMFEVSQEVAVEGDANNDRLRKELIQVAATATVWASRLL